MSTDKKTGGDNGPQLSSKNPIIAAAKPSKESLLAAEITDALPAQESSEQSTPPSVGDPQENAPVPESANPSSSDSPVLLAEPTTLDTESQPSGSQPENPTLAGENTTQSLASNASISESAIEADLPKSGSDLSDDLSETPLTKDVSFDGFINEHVFKFLDLIDIPNTGDRRAALVSLKLNEERIAARLDIANSFLKLQIAYLEFCGHDGEIETFREYLKKHSAFESWMTM